MITRSDDQVIRHRNTQHARRVGHTPGEREILGTRRWVTARVRVEEDEANRSTLQGGFEDLARFHGGTGHRASKVHALGNQTLGTTEVQRTHHLLSVVPIAEGKIAGHSCRTIEQVGMFDLSTGKATSKLNCSHDGGCFRGSDPGLSTKIGTNARQTRESSDRVEERSRKRKR